jgi:hypothetical protein
MSEQTNTRPCQWPERCAAAAGYHIQYGYQDRGVTDANGRGAGAAFTVMHADLCPAHFEEAKRRRSDIHEMPRGGCGADCPTNGPPARAKQAGA